MTETDRTTKSIIDRREFVGAMAAGLGLATLGAADSCNPGGNEINGEVDWLLVDVHCHTFNAADIPAPEFITVKLRQESAKWAGRLAEWLVRQLTSLAPSAGEERAALGARAAGPGLLRSLGEKSDARADDFFLGLDHELVNATEKRASTTQPDPLIEQIEREYGEAEERHSTIMRTITLGGDGPVGRYCRFARLLLKYRYEIVQSHIERYPGVHLLTPLIVDFDKWLLNYQANQASTPIADQLQLMGMINSKLADDGRMARVHPFVGFDPWRAADDPSVLDLTQEAIRTGGAVGIKLYPPMGFRPILNEGAEFADRNGGPDFGRKLDDALEALYAWCEEDGVPIIAHCSHSNYSERIYEEDERASPAWWKSVVQDTAGRFPGLTVDLGHSGATDEKQWNTEIGSWPRQIGEMMSPENRVYADLSYHPPISASDGDREHYFSKLVSFFETYPSAGERLMYGSDWAMLETRKKAREYLTSFIAGARNSLGDAMTGKLVGENAVRFLGITADDPGHQRLKDFYSRANMETPEFLKRAGEI